MYRKGRPLLTPSANLHPDEVPPQQEVRHGIEEGVDLKG